jgi:hypothetical protein
VPTRRIQYYRARALLCVVLILQLHFLTGCASTPSDGLDRWITVSLDAEHPLSIALEKSIFAGASSIEINPGLMAFRLHAPDGSRSITGAMGARGTDPAVRTMRISSAAASIDFVIDAADHITRISSGEGRVWTRTADDTTINPDLRLLDSYLSSNTEIVNTAQMMDGYAPGQSELPGSAQPPPTSNGKVAMTDQAIDANLGNLLSLLAALVGLQFVVANFPAVYFALQVFVSLQLTFAILGISPSFDFGTPPVTDETPSGNPIPSTTGGNTSGNSASSSANATLRVSNVLTNGVPIWYVVPVPSAGEQPMGNLLGNGAIPSGESRDFKLPQGVRTVNLICPDTGDCLRVYAKVGIDLLDGEVADVVLSTADLSSLYPTDCGG